MKLAKILICLLILAASALGKPFADKNGGDANIQSAGMIKNPDDAKMKTTIEEKVNLNQTKLIDYDEPEKEVSTKSKNIKEIDALRNELDLATKKIEELKKWMSEFEDLRKRNVHKYVATIIALVLMIASFLIIFICLFCPIISPLFCCTV